MNVGYTYYANTYNGQLSADEYGRLSVKASAYLDRVTFGRLDTETDETKLEKARLALCAVVDAMAEDEEAATTSEKIGTISVSYVQKKDGQRAMDAVNLFLGNTGLLYRGISV